MLATAGSATWGAESKSRFCFVCVCVFFFFCGGGGVGGGELRARHSLEASRGESLSFLHKSSLRVKSEGGFLWSS